MPTIVGIFPNRETTEDAIENLTADGVDAASIGVVWRDRNIDEPETVERISYRDQHDDTASEAGKGAVGGAIGGATAGAGTILLASAGVALIPGIGALLAAGTAAAAAVAAGAGAIGGAVTGGVFGALIGAGDHDADKIRDEDDRYQRAIEEDRYLVTVHADERSVERVADTMEDLGAEEVSVYKGSATATL